MFSYVFFNIQILDWELFFEVSKKDNTTMYKHCNNSISFKFSYIGESGYIQTSKPLAQLHVYFFSEYTAFLICIIKWKKDFLSFAYDVIWNC